MNEYHTTKWEDAEVMNYIYYPPSTLIIFVPYNCHYLAKHNSLLVYVYRVCYFSFACVNTTDEGPGLDQNVWNPFELYMQLPVWLP